VSDGRAIYALAGTDERGAPVREVERFDGSRWRSETQLPGPALNAPAAVVLDGLLNYVDRAVLLEHWPGDARSLDRVCRIAGRIAGWVPRRWKARVFGSAAA